MSQLGDDPLEHPTVARGRATWTPPRLLTADSVYRRIADEMAERFRGVFSVQTIDRYLVESRALEKQARIHTHLPNLTKRFCGDRLNALAQAEGRIRKDVPEVLFICVHNAGRSQMAAALLDHHADGRVHVRSAGSTPASEINPEVVKVMSEVGVDLSLEFPKPLTDDVVRAADVVITMGCGDACPVYPGKRYLDWDLADPSDRSVEEIRPIRDELDRRVRQLLDQLVTAPTAP